MTHRGMPPEAQREAGIAPDLLRLSVGLEDSDDLIADLERGFAAR
jgi:cystathionine gamma-synthase